MNKHKRLFDSLFLFNKIKTTGLIILFLSLFFQGKAAVELSDSLEASLLTILPGDELYSTFGHSAIRIKDLQNGHDLVFNYGTFNFNTPYFYLKFPLGRLYYMLSIEPFEDFMFSVKHENRTVIEQKINLPKAQKVVLLSMLLDNYKPQNRYYRYKFFTDNCATRVRDVLDMIVVDPYFALHTRVDSGKTFRELYRPYLMHKPWTLFGIELLMGPFADRKARSDALFLPQKLRESLRTTVFYYRPVVSSETVIYEGTYHKPRSTWFTPLMAMILLLLTCIAVEFTGAKKIFDKILFVVLGFLGLMILFFSLFSYHIELQKNIIILLLFPAVIVIPFIKSIKLHKLLSLLSFLIIIITLLILPFVKQVINIPTVLLSLSLAIRLFFNFISLEKLPTGKYKLSINFNQTQE